MRFSDLEVQYVSAQIRGGGQVVFAERNWSTSWNGVTADYFPINNWQLQQGEWFSPHDYAGAAKVAIIGTTVRDKLFEGSDPRSEEHTSELQSLMRISYAVFCLKK